MKESKQTAEQVVVQMLEAAVQTQLNLLKEKEASIYKTNLDAKLIAFQKHKKAKLLQRIVGSAPKQLITPTTAILDSEVLNLIQKANLMYKFAHIALSSQSVICCRLSPQEKATLVQQAHIFSPHLTTLAIGDGANDVGMI